MSITDYTAALTQIRNLLAEQPTPQARKVAISMLDGLIAASADTHPKDGDVKQAPLVSGAVPKADAQTRSRSLR